MLTRPLENRLLSLRGGLLCQPFYVCSVLLLVFNDHYLKHASPGVLSGKLSDFAGLCFFPVLLVSLLELARLLPPSARVRAVALCALGLLSALAFALVETWAPATAAYRSVAGALRWLPEALLALLRGRAAQFQRAAQTPDLSDLWALPCALVGWGWHALRMPRRDHSLNGNTGLTLPSARRASAAPHRTARQNPCRLGEIGRIPTDATTGSCGEPARHSSTRTRSRRAADSSAANTIARLLMLS